MISTDLGVWVSVIFFLFVYSFVFKYNKLFQFAEASAIGTAAGVLFATGIENIRKIALGPISEGNLFMAIPVIAGILLYARFLSVDLNYVSRIPLALMIGVGIGVGVLPILSARVITQIGALVMTVPETQFGVIDQIITIIGLISVLLLFTYTKEQRGLLGTVTRIGTAFVMFGLGVQYGTGITSRSTYLIDRLQKLFFELLGFG